MTMTEKTNKKALSGDIHFIVNQEDYQNIPLSPREIEVLEQLCNGYMNKDIAKILGISHQTVKNHVSMIFLKLGINTRTGAMKTAIERGYIIIERTEIITSYSQ